jgi:large subunit ribosomal protein L5
MISLPEQFKQGAIPHMKEKFGYKNDMAVPKITKVVVNTSFGKLTTGKTKSEAAALYEPIVIDMATITGQRPVVTDAKKSISTFKLRQGMPVGAKVTLRGKKMNAMVEKMVNIVLPRTRDFEGLNIRSIDNSGNLSIGIKEHIVFPEISAENIKRMFGLEVVITTTAKTHEQGLELFRSLGFPIKKDA